MTFINAVCAHSSKWMPHTRHPATGISQSVEAETPPPTPLTILLLQLYQGVQWPASNQSFRVTPRQEYTPD